MCLYTKNVLKTKIHNIPISTIIKKHPLDKSLFLAVSGSAYVDKNTKEIFYGYSAMDDYELAVKISRNEVLERMFAMRTFDENKNEKYFETYLVNNNTKVSTISKDDIFLRENSEHGFYSNSASGLSLHVGLNEAVEHGLFEIIERDILGRIWYEDQFITNAFNNENLKDDFFIEYYTVVENNIPFILSVVKSKNNNIIFCGSSVARSLSLAKEKARNEAMYLFYNYLSNNVKYGIGNNPDSLNRMKSLYDENAINKIVHLSKKTKQLNYINKSLNSSTKKLMKLYNIKEFAKYVVLNKFEDLILVKVFCKNLKSKNEYRLKYPNDLADPFC